MDNQDLIVVKQLPVIQEKLKMLSTELEIKLTAAKNLSCTEENKQTVKKLRADFNKEFRDLESRRKQVKEEILAPYMQFDEVYKEYIADKYKEADVELGNKINAIEAEQKKKLEDEAREYFEEYKTSKNIEFITFEKMNLKVGISDNPTKLKKQITAFIDKIADDLNLIETQEHKAEILVEYKQTLNVSNAITTVTARLKAIEEEKKKQEEFIREASKSVIISKEEKQEILQAPVIEVKQEDVLTLKFTVKATRTKLKALKEFLENGGYDYE